VKSGLKKEEAEELMSKLTAGERLHVDAYAISSLRWCPMHICRADTAFCHCSRRKGHPRVKHVLVTRRRDPHSALAWIARLFQHGQCLSFSLCHRLQSACAVGPDTLRLGLVSVMVYAGLLRVQSSTNHGCVTDAAARHSICACTVGVRWGLDKLCNPLLAVKTQHESVGGRLRP